jgi:hypothetical protein
MPAVIEKIADALHIPRAHHSEQQSAAEASGSAAPVVDNKPNQPVFDSSKVTVIFILGGPGAGVYRCPFAPRHVSRNAHIHRQGYTVRQPRPRL